MNWLRSASVNIFRGRFVPWPMMTYFSPPAFMWLLSVLIEQPSFAAASAGVRRPSGGRGLRWRRLLDAG